MDNITVQLPFSEKDIDIQNYTASLLAYCAVNKIIEEEKLQKIAIGIQAAFTETAEQFTKRESSTITKNRAELLYSSVLYQADVYLMSLSSINEAVNELSSLPIETILERGKEIILSVNEANKKIFRRAFKTRLNVPCFEYKYVMEKAFDDYVKGYSARFDARNCCASIDYPLLNCPAYNMKSQGALFTNEYYTGIMLENAFCQYFEPKKIDALLKAYGKIYKCDYTDLLFNIAEVLLNNLLSAALLGKAKFNIVLSNEDLETIEKSYKLFPKEKLCDNVEKAFSAYKDIFQNEALYEYLKKHIEAFSEDISLRMSGGLKNFLVVTDI